MRDKGQYTHKLAETLDRGDEGRGVRKGVPVPGPAGVLSPEDLSPMKPGIAEPGYWIHDAVLSPYECEALVRELASPGVARGRAGARHLMAHPAVAEAARDPRLMEIARSTLGEQVMPFRATLFEKMAEGANWLVVWHQDTALPLEEHVPGGEWGPWSRKAGVLYAHAPTWALSRVVALRLHLDDSTAENGPLRVIPGSHTLGVLSDVEVAAYARTREPVDCVAHRGGVVAMRPLVIHASSKARGPEPRRVLHVEYADALDLAPGIRLAVT